MPQSRKKKYNKKKKNPNRAPQNQSRKAQSGAAKKSGSNSVKPAAASNPKSQKQMWIALAIALGAFLLLLLIARLTGRDNAQDAAPDTASVQSGESVASGDAETVESGDAESVQSGDAESVQSGETVASGDAETMASGDAGSVRSGDAETVASGDAQAVRSGDGAVTETTASGAASTADSGATQQAATSAANGSNDAQSTASGGASATTTASGGATAALQSAGTQEAIGIEHADIVVKDYGTISVELDGMTAPITVQNFVSLAKSGFYDGLTFHRIMDGFMIQGGDPLGNGNGGAENNIVGEFKSNGIANDISHVRGTISMARASGDENSASSQFFIVQTDSEFLDGEYAGFGHVTSGMEVVDKICKDAKPIDDNGTIKPEEQPVIESVTIRES